MRMDRSARVRRKLTPSYLAVASISIWTGVVQAQPAPSAPSAPIQLYGLVGTYIAESKVSGVPRGSVVLGGGGLMTSFWGLRAKEDLGGGYAAVFVLESFFRPNTGQLGRNATDGLFSRNAYLGFTSPYGIFRLGEQTTHTYLNQILLNPFGSSVVFSPLVVQSYTAAYNNTVVGDTVWDNVASYESASYRGLTGTVQYGVSGASGHQGKDNLGLHLNYENGPLQVALSAQRVRMAVNLPNVQQYLYLAALRTTPTSPSSTPRCKRPIRRPPRWALILTNSASRFLLRRPPRCSSSGRGRRSQHRKKRTRFGTRHPSATTITCRNAPTSTPSIPTTSSAASPPAAPTAWV